MTTATKTWWVVRLVKRRDDGDPSLDGGILAEYEPWVDLGFGVWGAVLRVADDEHLPMRFRTRLDAIKWAYKVSEGDPVRLTGKAAELNRPLPDTWDLSFETIEEA